MRSLVSSELLRSDQGMSMPRTLINHFTACTLIVCGAFVCSIVAQDSQPTRRPSRRITNPVRGQQPPLTEDSGVRIISTAEDTATEAAPSEVEQPRPSRRRNTSADAANANNSTLRRTVEQLNGQVSQLTAQLAEMREQQRALVNFERLSRAEQRAENYRAQLRDVTQREAALQARLDQIEIDILPENIQMRAAGMGSLRADQVREQMQTLLDKERTRTRTQLDLLTQSRTRLEAVIVSADAEVARLSETLNETTTTETAAAPPAEPVAAPVVTPEPTEPQTDGEPPRL